MLLSKFSVGILAGNFFVASYMLLYMQWPRYTHAQIHTHAGLLVCVTNTKTDGDTACSQLYFNFIDCFILLCVLNHNKSAIVTHLFTSGVIMCQLIEWVYLRVKDIILDR